MKQKNTIGYRIGWLLGICAATVIIAGVYTAPGSAQDFSSGYTSRSPVSAGMAVSLVPEQDKVVEPTHRENLDDVLGVVVSGSESLFTVTSEQSNVQVVTSGVTKMLVTDTNDTIRSGDYITASNVEGIGMRADDDHGKVIARARKDFAEADTRTVEVEEEEPRTVSVARIPVAIQIGGNPEAKVTDSPLPGFLQGTANMLAGQPVSPARIVISLVIVAGGLVGSMVLLYGAVSSTIISIGRNPLSNKSIYAGLFRMVLIALMIVLISLVLGYGVITI